MGRGWAGAWLVLALVTSSRAEGQGDEERWSRQATAERRQGDWVPLSCANCRPIDQAPQGSDGLPSVLTPPPRSEGARLLPPPPPPDGLLQQAATGFIQALNQQQQQQRKPHQQFLQETTAQSINRPQAQFLNSPQQSYVPEPSLDFQPPQQFTDQQSNRQPQQLQFNRQNIPESNPYLNQPFLLSPQFLPAPFFPPSSFPQNIQPINPTQIQPLSPISPLQLPINKDNFQVPPERPVFVQQITAGGQIPPSAPQQELHQAQQSQHVIPSPNPSQASNPQQGVAQSQFSQLEYSVNQTNTQGDEQESEEVQLLYVPVETLNQRARNLGRQKSLQANQQGITSQQLSGSQSNRFTSPGKDHEYSTRKPHIEDQDSFNTQTKLSKHQYNSPQNIQFQQQQPPVDQEKFNSQTHTVRHQYVEQDGQFQQPTLGNPQNFKLDIQSTKEQYNFKQNNQQQSQVDLGHLNPQLQTQQTDTFQHQSPLENPVNFQSNAQNINQQFSEQNPQYVQQNHANLRGSNANQQFTTQLSVNNLQQQLPPLEQSSINIPHQQDLRSTLNTQIPQLQIHQPTGSTLQDQPYVNQPIQFDQQFNVQQTQAQHSLSQQQHQHQQFRTPETPQPTDSPVTQTVTPDVYTTQQSKRQRFRNPQHAAQSHEPTRNVQQHQSSQTLKKFPQDYQHTTIGSLKQSVGSAETEVTTQINNIRQSLRNNQYSSSQQSNNHGNQEQYYDKQGLNHYQPDHQVPSPPPPSTSSIPPPQASPAPNQPPLSVYMETNGASMVNDVLRLLKNAKTIQVLDTVGPDSPQVFVGPSNLKAPTGYIKFELPYLNTLENNRVERKVDTLPFFVAPLNFNPPPGYSKIPFPAPHIGSVVVSNVTVLQTALHEKTYGHEPVTVSSSERYLDQYTLPAEISPISPQLPSLINSLQDDIYSGSSSTSAPTPVPETTTVQVTQYRGRGTSRGSQRGSSDYQTSPSPTRRPQSRTRRPWDGRPYSRRQPVTNPTTTLEPSTEAPVPQFTPQPEQLSFNNEAYNFQNSPAPTNIQSESSQHKLEQTGTYFDDQSIRNNYNLNQFAPNQQQAEQPVQLIQTPNIQPVAVSKDVQNVQQYYDNSQIQQEAFVPAQEAIHTTTLPSATSPQIQQEEHTFKSQRNSGSRREPSRHHQRFRGRQRLTTTTTTENYEDPVQQTGNEYNQQVDTGATYQNIPRNRQRSHHQQRLVENTHFQANVPVNRYNSQTERADIGVQTTERLISAHIPDQPIQQNFNQFNQEEYTSSLNKGHQVHQPASSQGVQSNTFNDEQQYQFQQPQSQLSQSSLNITENHKDFINLQFAQHNQDQLYVDQLQGTGAQGQLDAQVQPTQTNFQQNYQEPVVQTQQQGQQNYFGQQAQFEQVAGDPQNSQTYFNNLNSDARLNSQVQNQNQQNHFASLNQQNKQEVITPVQEESHTTTNTHQHDNYQSQFLPQQENVRESSNINLSLQGQQIPASQFDQGSDVTPTTSQGAIIQTQVGENAQSQIPNEPETPNSQLRLVKYNKLHSRTPSVSSSPLNEEHTRRGQHQYETSDVTSDPSTTEATTRASLVRVRGRVRGRQRGVTRNPHTTTEAPNYPTTYLSRQRNSQEKDDSQDNNNNNYTPRKRVSYSARQPYTSVRNNKEVLSDQSTTEKNYGINERQQPSTERYQSNIEVTKNYGINERQQPSSERYQSNIEVTATTTTTTEEPTTKVARRYKHILNRNKVRRTRPTDSPSSSGSSGTAKFLVPTTPPPVTRLPSTRGRIRKPVSVKTTTSTTEYPQVNSKWNEKDNFAPSAGSNEILEPFYQTRDKPQQSFGFQHTPVIQNVPSTPKPIIPPSTGEDDYWNQGVTIQQSTSFDFKPDFAAVTPPSFQGENGKFQGTFSPIWDGQIELQDGNYYDVFRQQQIAKQLNDQTPFSSDHQKVIYQGTKNKHSLGKENQYTEKTHEVRPVEIDEETPSDERVYPVYREIIKPAETIQDEASQVYTDTYEGEGKHLHEKDTVSENSDKSSPSEEVAKTEAESETKEGPLKQKIFASQPGKKGGRRRGSWVRVRVRKPQDMFETAESQNLASLSENDIPSVTKTTAATVGWTPEPSTEPAPTVSTSPSPSPSEPAETINFEEALKDMLKDFITNSDGEEEKEEVSTEETTDTLTNTNNTTATTDVNSEEPKEETLKVEEHTPSEDEATHTETDDGFQTENKDEVINDENTIKTVVPDITPEVLTQQPTTMFQTPENIETTIEPELTTLVNEQEYKSPPSRILGTSTTTEISLETEICYRGRCVKTKKVDSDSDLLSME